VNVNVRGVDLPISSGECSAVPGVIMEIGKDARSRRRWKLAPACLDRPVLIVLVVSLALIVVLFGLLWLGFNYLAA
jgi:hypothetical protein